MAKADSLAHFKTGEHLNAYRFADVLVAQAEGILSAVAQNDVDLVPSLASDLRETLDSLESTLTGPILESLG